MQCSNCDRKIVLADGQFCPYCASPLNLSIKEKKKKNDGNSSNFKFDWSAALFTLLLLIGALLTILFLIAVSRSTVEVLCFIPFIVIGVAAFMFSNRCEWCGQFFTMNKVGHEQVGSQKVYQMLENPTRQIVVLRKNWRDTYRCSYCQHQKAYIRNEDFNSFTE